MSGVALIETNLNTANPELVAQLSPTTDTTSGQEQAFKVFDS